MRGTAAGLLGLGSLWTTKLIRPAEMPRGRPCRDNVSAMLGSWGGILVQMPQDGTWGLRPASCVSSLCRESLRSGWPLAPLGSTRGPAGRCFPAQPCESGEEGVVVQETPRADAGDRGARWLALGFRVVVGKRGSRASSPFPGLCTTDLHARPFRKGSSQFGVC